VGRGTRAGSTDAGEPQVGEGLDALERGREACARSAWLESYEALSLADRASPLGATDLELLARSAYMLGRDGEYRSGLEQAHRLYLEAGDSQRAVRCAFWIGHNLLFRGELDRASGWFGRASRLLEREPDECVEHGYLLIPVWLQQMGSGDWAAGYVTAGEAAAIGERFGDADLRWLAADEQSRALVNLGRVTEGLRLVDEVLVAAAAGELSPLVTGIVYCNTIAFCQSVYEVRTARAWTDALTQWCESQPEMVAHNGLCLVHRAEIMQLQGAWPGALEEAGRAAERYRDGVLNELARGKALYRQAEVRRLRGELAAAEEAYVEASRCGFEPQPGLALLRLMQGKTDAAAAAVRRALAEATRPLERAALLPAAVEIMLAIGDLEEARRSSAELDAIAERHGSDVLRALSAHALGAVALAAADAPTALAALRRAAHAWRELDAPYEAAHARVLLGLACARLEDEDTARLELAAARDVFVRLGATPDVHRVDSLAAGPPAGGAHGLTARERQVLRLVAAGKSNRAIADELVISDHTVRRHLQNIFRKVGVSSRAAATAFAFRHDLT
jgi:DNA-binding NarL/FixJ family response regulator